MKIMKTLIFSLFFEKFQLSQTVAMANFFSAFSLPYKFPSRNKKENAAEITFVLKASPLPLLPSSIFRACSLIIEAERKKEGKRKAQVDNETDSSRVAFEF